jgi:hypothetical protein
VILPKASESTRFMTRSFSTMLLAWQYLVGLKTADTACLDALHKLPDCAEKVIQTWLTFSHAGIEKPEIVVYDFPQG